MNNQLKILFFVLACIYVISPVDAVPGPIDDLIVVVLGIIPQVRQISHKE